MKITDDIHVIGFSIAKVSKKYGKWILKMCGNPAISNRWGEKATLH